MWRSGLSSTGSNRFQWRNLENMLTNFWNSETAVNFFTTWTTVNFSRRALLYCYRMTASHPWLPYNWMQEKPRTSSVHCHVSYQEHQTKWPYWPYGRSIMGKRGVYGFEGGPQFLDHRGAIERREDVLKSLRTCSDFARHTITQCRWSCTATVPPFKLFTEFNRLTWTL